METNLSMNAPSLLVLDEKWNIRDFLCSRLNLNVMSDIKDHSLMDDKALSAVRYIDTLHKLNVFHGDIKPQNFFYLNDKCCKYALREGDKDTLSSDCGTLTILDPDDSDKTYLITQYTPAFSSKAHHDAVKNGLPRSKRDLLREDRWQLYQTLVYMRRMIVRLTKKELSERVLRVIEALKEVDSVSWEEVVKMAKK